MGVGRFTSTDMTRMSGATYRQLDYWAHRGWIAGQEGEQGSGYQRMWTEAQLMQAEALVQASKVSRAGLPALAAALVHKCCKEA